MLALVWFPGGPHGLKSVAAPGRAQLCLPLGSPPSCQGPLPQSRFLLRLVLRLSGSWQQTASAGSLGSLAQAITGPFQSTADWGTSRYFPSFESGFSSLLPALPSAVPRYEAADWVRAEVCGSGQFLSSKPTFTAPLSAETELQARWKQ